MLDEDGQWPARRLPGDAGDAGQHQRVAHDLPEQRPTLVHQHRDRRDVHHRHQHTDQETDRSQARLACQAARDGQGDVGVEAEAALKACGEHRALQAEKRARQAREHHAGEGVADPDGRQRERVAQRERRVGEGAKEQRRKEHEVHQALEPRPESRREAGHALQQRTEGDQQKIGQQEQRDGHDGRFSSPRRRRETLRGALQERPQTDRERGCAS